VKILLLSALVALSGLAAGCGGSSVRRAATPSERIVLSGPPAPLEVTQPMTEILGTDGVNVAVRSRILIRNPNPFPVTLRSLDGVLYLDSAQAATAHIEGTDVLDARTDRIFQLDANVPLQLILGVRSRSYVTSGSITAFTADGTPFVSPFSFEGPLPSL
jgi:hypothetical protein